MFQSPEKWSYFLSRWSFQQYMLALTKQFAVFCCATLFWLMLVGSIPKNCDSSLPGLKKHKKSYYVNRDFKRCDGHSIVTNSIQFIALFSWYSCFKVCFSFDMFDCRILPHVQREWGPSYSSCPSWRCATWKHPLNHLHTHVHMLGTAALLRNNRVSFIVVSMKKQRYR